MVPLANLVAFALVAVPLIIVPGPSVLFVVGRSLSLGRLGGLLSVVGNALGALVAAAVVALGLGIVIAQSELLFTIVKVVGAAYLIFLGVQAIRHRRQQADAATNPVAPRAKWRLLMQGFVVGATNPKSIIFFLAVLPQFVDYPAGNIATQLLVLGAVFAAIALLSDGTWALIAGTARDWFAKSPQRISALAAAGGVVMIALGVGSLFLAHGATTVPG